MPVRDIVVHGNSPYSCRIHRAEPGQNKTRCIRILLLGEIQDPGETQPLPRLPPHRQYRQGDGIRATFK
ncbi:hypothetical protein [Methanoregula boonei]|uniref:hypothetical protein n=1 Tax=Methanoregula boonei TaxID=358766 RepID=UPI0012FCB6C7|nr:hypothetical protein [Methanoregula boonei]